MNAATVPPSAPADVTAPASDQAPASRGGLGTRLLSAVILGPAVLAAVWFGSPWFDVLVLLAGILLAAEWAGLCGADSKTPAIALMIAATLPAVAAAVFGQYGLGLLLAFVGMLAAGAVAATLRAAHPVWLAVGTAYVALPCVVLLWIRLGHETGAVLTIWMMLVIWAADSGAYFAGKTIGGPKLAPSISPKKTWAGLGGGLVAAALVGGLGAMMAPGHPVLPLVALGAVLAVLSQGGDLFESHAKRRFGVKDSGQLIPGHGGLLDRVDGLIVGILVLGAVLYWGGRAP